MIDRFLGTAGQILLIEALRTQGVFEGSEILAGQIAAVVELKAYHSGEVLIAQNAPDNDIAFLLSGVVSILVNGREVNRRRAGQSVGEMTLIDPSARRSASVLALGKH